jgi:hypothetical protein
MHKTDRMKTGLQNATSHYHVPLREGEVESRRKVPESGPSINL